MAVSGPTGDLLAQMALDSAAPLFGRCWSAPPALRTRATTVSSTWPTSLTSPGRAVSGQTV